MLTRSLVSKTARNFSTNILRAPTSKQSNLRMVTSLAVLGLGWSCISRLNYGGLSLCGRVKRAQCEIAADDTKDMMSMMLGNPPKFIVLKKKYLCLAGAVLGHIIPGANCLIWYT
jgi:hypothetical protein